MWLPRRRIVAVVISSKNIQAQVMVLHPRISAGKEVEIENLRLEKGGGFLQQILGPQVAPFHQPFRKKDLGDGESGEVLTLSDNDGCVKMAIQGPNILSLQQLLPKDVKEKMKKTHG